MWHDLLALNLGTNCSWILLGDFNIFMHQDERLSRVLFSQNETDEIVNYNPIDWGHFYTWNNRQKDGLQVWSKLDRALLNPAAMESPWSILIEFRVPGVSDHCRA